MSEFRAFLLLHKLECITVYIDTTNAILFVKALFKTTNVVAMVSMRASKLTIERQAKNIYHVQTVERVRFWRNVSMHPFTMPNVMVRRRCHVADAAQTLPPLATLSSHVDVDSSGTTIHFRDSDLDSTYLFSKVLRYGMWFKLSRYKCLVETAAFLLHLDNDDVVTQYAFCTRELDAHVDMSGWIVVSAADMPSSRASIAHVNEQFVSRQRNRMQQNLLTCRAASGGGSPDVRAYLDRCEQTLRQSDSYTHLLVRYGNVLDGVCRRHFVNKGVQRELIQRIEKSMATVIAKRATQLTQSEIELDEFTLALCNWPSPLDHHHHATFAG